MFWPPNLFHRENYLLRFQQPPSTPYRENQYRWYPCVRVRQDVRKRYQSLREFEQCDQTDLHK